MTIGENELSERLESSDDEAVYATLVECFEPVYEDGPFAFRWRPRASIVVHADPGQPAEGLRGRLIGLANYAQRKWRRLRFERLREEEPELPVVVCEGDSWVAHPLIDDITDHLLDDTRHPFLALGVGAAADRLSNMNRAAEYRDAILEHDASALVLSGGGNDLLDTFQAFLPPCVGGAEPQPIITEAVDAAIGTVMATMREILVKTQGLVPVVVVHGYDHLCVRKAPGKGGTLGRFFDDAGIMERAERHAVLRSIVDRYNEQLRHTVDQLATGRDRWVSYVDLRGAVPHVTGPCEEWDDDIHPTSDGFARITERIATTLRERLSHAH